MNGKSGLCEGCGRTLSEIADWFNLSDSEKRAIVADLPNRDRFAAKGPPGTN